MFSVFLSGLLFSAVTVLPFPAEPVCAAQSSGAFDDASLREYHITSVQDLLDFGHSNLDFQGKTVYLDADLDMTGVEWNPRDFYGCFDGQYHTLENLNISDDYNYKYNASFNGLFRRNYGDICRLNLANFDVFAFSAYWAELYEAGRTPEPGAICTESGSLGVPEGAVICVYNAPGYAGGICAYNNGMICGCTADGKAAVSASYEQCSSESIKKATNYKGEYSGNICANNKGTIRYCTANDKICDSNSAYSCKDCEPDYQWTHADVDAIMQEQDLSEIGRLTLSDDTVTVYEGMSKRMEAKINDCSVQAAFESEDPEIAYVDAYNFVQGVSPGDTRIKAIFENQIRYLDVHVSELGTFTVSPASITLAEGRLQTIRAEIDGVPVDASYSITEVNGKPLSGYQITATTVASVENGVVEGRASGDVVVAVWFGNLVEYVDVHVFSAIQKIPANDFSDRDAAEYRITTAEGLLAFAEACGRNALAGKTVYLDADIDMTGQGYVPPESFSGTFDGRYHTITGLRRMVSYEEISLSQYRGRGEQSADVYGGAFVNHNYGTIIRLNLAGLGISAKSWLFAELSSDGSSLATACYISAYAGGICGRNTGSICGCTVQGKASAGSDFSPANWMPRYDTAEVYGISGDGYKGVYCNADLESDEPLPEEIKELVNKEYGSKYPIGMTNTVSGDVNSDGIFNLSDVVLLQKWLLAVPETDLANRNAADLCCDNRLDVVDLCLMKRLLMEHA